MHELYTLTLYAITVVPRHGTGVVFTCGVKQGCQLSPTLFGLLLDGLRRALLERTPARHLSFALAAPWRTYGHLAGSPAPPRHSTCLSTCAGRGAQS